MTTAAESAESVFRYSASLPRAAATPAFLRILESPKKFALRSQTNFLPPNSGGVAAAWSVWQNGFFCVFRLLRGAVYDLFGHFVERVFRQFIKISRARLAAMKSSSEVIKYAALLSIAFKFFPAAGFVNINFDIEIF